MKALVGVTFWNKRDHLVWLLEGIIENFSPEDTEVAFHFDACTDESELAFDSLVPYWLLKRGGFQPEQVHKLVSNPEVREVGGHNQLIQLGLARQCEFIVVAQDDQRFNQPLRNSLLHLKKTYGDRLGVVTGRDAYGAGYSNFSGSFWTESNVSRKLQHGEFLERPYLNSGPIVYNSNLIAKVGLLDSLFRSHYLWDDFGARAHKAGFVNGVLGMDITHAKFGRMTASTWTDASADLARLRAKHGEII